MALKGGKTYSAPKTSAAAKTAPAKVPAAPAVTSAENPVIAAPVETAKAAPAPEPAKTTPLETVKTAPVETTAPAATEAPATTETNTNTGSKGEPAPVKLPADTGQIDMPTLSPSGTITGDEGDNLLNGTSGNDYIRGLGGNDTLNGGQGLDKLEGGTGHDLLNGGTGNDTLHGGSGNDTLNGEDGNDVLYGNSGNDVIAGGRHNDTIYGDDADKPIDLIGPPVHENVIDVDAFDFQGGNVPIGFKTEGNMITFDMGVTGDPHDDELDFVVGKGSEKIRVDFGSQNVTSALVNVGLFFVDPGNHPELGQWKALDAHGNVLATGTFTATDVFGSGSGNFQFVINPGVAFQTLVFTALDNGNRADADNSDYALRKITYTTQQITQDTFNDTLNGGTGDDLVYGMRGEDSINGGDGNDTLYGGTGNDTIDGSRNNDWIEGGQGDDSLLGGSGNDTLFGGAGMDTLRGGDGDDHLHGNEDMDELSGGNGNDEMWGWEGDDWMFGGEGMDWMHGWSGHDHLHGDGGNDMLFGEDGNDLIEGGTDEGTMGVAYPTPPSTPAPKVTINFSGAAVENGHVIGVTVYGIDGCINIIGGNVTELEQIVLVKQNNIIYGYNYETVPAGSDIIHFNGHEDYFEGLSGAEPGGSNGPGNGPITPFFSFVMGDQLTGGAGADTFIYHSGDGVDFIKDFQKGIDKLELHLNAGYEARVFHQDGDTIIVFENTQAAGPIPHYAADSAIVLVDVLANQNELF